MKKNKITFLESITDMSMRDLGEFVKECRKKKGLKSIRALARKMGNEDDAKYLSELERGLIVGTPEHLIQVAKALEIRPGLLLDKLAGEPNHQAEKEIHNNWLITELLNLVESYRLKLAALEGLNEMGKETQRAPVPSTDAPFKKISQHIAPEGQLPVDMSKQGYVDYKAQDGGQEPTGQQDKPVEQKQNLPESE